MSPVSVALGRRVVRRPLVSESRGERGLVGGWRGRLLFAFALQERLYSNDATGDAGRQRRPLIREAASDPNKLGPVHNLYIKFT